MSECDGPVVGVLHRSSEDAASASCGIDGEIDTDPEDAGLARRRAEHLRHEGIVPESRSVVVDVSDRGWTHGVVGVVPAQGVDGERMLVSEHRVEQRRGPGQVVVGGTHGATTATSMCSAPPVPARRRRRSPHRASNAIEARMTMLTSAAVR